MLGHVLSKYSSRGLMVSLSKMGNGNNEVNTRQYRYLITVYVTFKVCTCFRNKLLFFQR